MKSLIQTAAVNLRKSSIKFLFSATEFTGGPGLGGRDGGIQDIGKCIFSVSSLYLLCVFSVSSLYLQLCIFSVSSHYLLCTFSVSSLYLLCIFSVSSLYLLCTFSVPSLYLLCTFSVPSLYLLCAFSVSVYKRRFSSRKLTTISKYPLAREGRGASLQPRPPGLEFEIDR